MLFFSLPHGNQQFLFVVAAVVVLVFVGLLLVLLCFVFKDKASLCSIGCLS